jgi:hypothetical protein
MHRQYVNLNLSNIKHKMHTVKATSLIGVSPKNNDVSSIALEAFILIITYRLFFVSGKALYNMNLSPSLAN